MILFGRKKNFSNSSNLEDIPVSYLQQHYTLPGVLARSAYDNGFAPVSAISDEIMKRNLRLGDPTDPEKDVTSQYQLWNAFIRPNDRMGFTQFVDLLVAGILSLSELNLLVWHHADNTVRPGAPAGGFTLDNIAGFTVLSSESKSLDGNGQETWTVTSRGGTARYYRKDVLTLKYSLLPDDGVTGISPGSASAQEAAIRDRLNQQQRALFDNGATPSLIVTIYARSFEEGQAIQQSYERRNRGAAKSGGVVYQTVIDNPIAGASQPRIEITPVGSSNHDLAIKEIVDYTEKTITSNYAVSPIIYGDATTTTFQNQELADRKFMGRVQSVLVRLFSVLEGELARLCGLASLPFTFVWDDVELDITEQQKVRAETKTETTRAYLSLIKAGVAPAKAAEVLELDESWGTIEITAPEAVELPGYQLAANRLGCGCETRNSDRRVDDSREQDKIASILEDIAREQYDGRIENARRLSKLELALVAELTRVMEQGSSQAHNQIETSAGRQLVDYSGLSPATILQLEKRASRVVSNYREFVSEKLASLPEDDPVRETFEGFYREHARNRATTIAGQETKYAFQQGEYDSAQNIQSWLDSNEPQSYIVKTWQTTSEVPCQFCQAMNGVQAGIQDSFVPGGLIENDGVVLVLDTSYSDGTIPDAHVNCRCKFDFKLRSK